MLIPVVIINAVIILLTLLRHRRVQMFIENLL